MKKLAVLVIFMVITGALVTAVGQYETVGAMKSMPPGVQAQARWGMQPPPAGRNSTNPETSSSSRYRIRLRPRRLDTARFWTARLGNG